MSGPIGAGAGAPAPTGLRKPTPAEEKELVSLFGPGRLNRDALLKWFQSHPDVRADVSLRGDTQKRHQFTPIGIVMLHPSIPPTHPLVEEIFRHISTFDRAYEDGPTLEHAMKTWVDSHKKSTKWARERYETGLHHKFENLDNVKKQSELADGDYNRIKAKYDILRTKMVAPLAEVRMADSLARQKNLPDEVGELIASKLSGTTGTIQGQQATLKKSAGMSGGRRKRKTRRNTSRKQGARR